MISQSSTIAFFLLIGFVVYVTMKGELVAYAGTVGLGPKAPSKQPTTEPTTLTGAFINGVLGVIPGA
jgi:hypothetical protein